MPEDRYPGYDVLRKRDTLSWNDITREVIDQRLAVTDTPEFFSGDAFQTLRAVCERIMPQAGSERLRVPTAGLLDRRLVNGRRDGHRDARLPDLRESWTIGLAALDAEARARHGQRFHLLDAAAQDELLQAMQDGELHDAAWQGMPSDLFFNERLGTDIIAIYYSHPTAWSEIGFGGPASPRGYVRMYFDRRDPWEAIEAKPGDRAKTREANRHVR